MDETIHQHRPLLISLAYNILGDIQEAECIVYDAVEDRYEERCEVQQHKAYWSRVVVPKSIGRLEAAKKEGAPYNGPWLPVPVVTEAPSLERNTRDLLAIPVLAL